MRGSIELTDKLVIRDQNDGYIYIFTRNGPNFTSKIMYAFCDRLSSQQQSDLINTCRRECNF